MEISASEFSHLDNDGRASMVDVSERVETIRTATASGKVLLHAKVVQALRDHSTPKGDVLATSRLAGIMGAKQTSQLIPLCHPIAIHGVSINLEITDYGVAIFAEVKTADRTGVEMEALTAISVAALTIIDMTKAIDPYFEITEVKMLSKSGGRNGSWSRDS